MSASLLHDPERFVAAAAASLMKTEAEILAEVHAAIAKSNKDITQIFKPEFLRLVACLRSRSATLQLIHIELGRTFGRQFKLGAFKGAFKDTCAEMQREAHKHPAGRDWLDDIQRSETTGKTLPTVDNTAIFLENHPEVKGAFSFNEMTRQVEIVKRLPPPFTDEVGEQLTDQTIISAVRWLEQHTCMVRFEIVARVLDAVAKQNSHHPLRDYLESPEWDGVPRLETWPIDYLGVTSSDSDPNYYAQAVAKKFLVSAVARAMEPGCKADCALVLEGPQGHFKSSAVRILAGEKYWTDQIGDLMSKDSSMALNGAWFVEIPEMDSLCRTGVTSARIKAYISQKNDRYRPPYGRCMVEVPRQCVFIGTTNTHDWLKDETGGRRFWPLRCGHIDIDALQRDRDQLWAEAVHCYRAGETWWLDDADVIKQATEEQAERFAADPLFEKIIAAAEAEAELPMSDPRESASVSEILTRLGFAIDKQDQRASNRVSHSLTAAGWERFRSGKRGETRPWRYRKAVSQ